MRVGTVKVWLACRMLVWVVRLFPAEQRPLMGLATRVMLEAAVADMRARGGGAGTSSRARKIMAAARGGVTINDSGF
jgi:hypothetical protein